MAYVLTRADFEADAQPHGEHLPTRPLTPLEVEELVEPERRYKPEPGELDAVAPETTAHDPRDPASHGVEGQTQGARRRTLRLRVFDFKPLVRPSRDG